MSSLRVAFTVLAAVVLTACGSDDRSGESLGSSGTSVSTDLQRENPESIATGSTPVTVEHDASSVEAESDSGGGVDGPLMYAAARSDTEDAMAAMIIGTLELDGECLYTTFDGNRYPVLWPHGTTWDENNSSVVLANGTSLALGTELDGGGGYMNIDVFSDVVDNDSAVSLARRCAEAPSFEIAVMN